MNANTPTAALRYADLLEPVSEDNPCGPDLEYDQAFVMLQAAVAPRADAQYGDFVDAPQPVNWAEVERDCRALLLRTKDIRLLTTLARCRIRQSGATGLRDSLDLVMTMLERYGELLHPRPYFEGARDPVMFANAIAALADPAGALADVRDIALPKVTGLQLQLRDVEKAYAVPRAKDALAPESVNRMLKELWVRRDKTVAALAEAQRFATAIGAWSSQALDADAPDLDALNKVLHAFAQAGLDGGAATPAPQACAPETQIGAAASPAPMASAEPATATTAGTQPLTEPAPIARMDRWGALSTLQSVRTWFEENEPSSPVVVLLRQCERMVGKRFSELAHIIPADLLAKWDEIDA